MDAEFDSQSFPSWSGDAIVIDTGVVSPRGWGRWFERFEASAGLLATTFLGFGPVVPLAIGTLSALNAGHPLLAILCGCVTLLAAGLAVLVGAIVGHAVRACFPEWADDPASQLHLRDDKQPSQCHTRSFAVEAAMSLPAIPSMLRPLLAVWWIMHFAAGALIAVAMHELIGAAFPATLAGVLVATILHFAYLLASNAYLVLAIAILFRDEEPLLEGVWSMRFFLDTIITIVVLLYCL